MIPPFSALRAVALCTQSNSGTVLNSINMAGQGALIIIIPNDAQENPIQSPTESTDPVVESMHSKEFPCNTCGPSLTSRFRHHVSPKLNLTDAVWVRTLA